MDTVKKTSEKWFVMEGCEGGGFIFSPSISPEDTLVFLCPFLLQHWKPFSLAWNLSKAVLH